jgi:hypothetical protein
MPLTTPGVSLKCFKGAKQWENMVLEDLERDRLPVGSLAAAKVAAAR